MSSNNVELKYLGFVREIAVKILLLLSHLYDFAKESAGIFKSMIVSVENAVVSFIGPTYDELKDLPDDILSFFDNKFDKHAPTVAKKTVTTTQSAAKKITPLANQLLGATQPIIQNGLSTTKFLLQSNPLVGAAQTVVQTGLTTTNSIVKASPLGGAAETLIKIGSQVGQEMLKEGSAAGFQAAFNSALVTLKVVGIPALVQYWYKADKNSIFHEVASVVLPVVEYLSESYNKAVKYMVGKGFSIFNYFPLVPIEEVEKAYKVVKAANDSLSAVEGLTNKGLSAFEGLLGAGKKK